MKKRTVLSIVIVLVAALVLRIWWVSEHQTYKYSPEELALQNHKDRYDIGPPDPDELLELVNAERARVGIAPLRWHASLEKASILKAQDMDKNNYFDHIMPSTGKTYNDEMLPLLRDGCKDNSENIYTGTGVAWTSRNALRGWFESKPHKDAILNPTYTDTGFGVAGNMLVEKFCTATN